MPFLHVRSCERVGLRREKSLFAFFLPASRPPATHSSVAQAFLPVLLALPTLTEVEGSFEACPCSGTIHRAVLPFYPESRRAFLPVL